ncbi:MAG: FG-GAP repeat protein [Myxococcota bacterium]
MQERAGLRADSLVHQLRCGAFTFCALTLTTTQTACFAPPIPNRAPQLDSPARVSVEENTVEAFYTATASDLDGDAIAFAVVGTDAELFEINASSGTLTFVEAPNAESPRSRSGSNTYEIEIQAADGQGGIGTLPLEVVVVDVVELELSLDLATGEDNETIDAQWSAIGDDTADIERYELEFDPDGGEEFVSDSAPTRFAADRSDASIPISPHLLRWRSVRYRLRALDASDQLLATSTVVPVADTVDSRDLVSTLRADDPETCSVFGRTVALSTNGTVLAVSASFQNDESGSVYIFRRRSSGWERDTVLVGSNTEIGDRFGSSLALSPSGATLVVGADGEASTGNSSDNSAPGAGAAYVFLNTNAGWNEVAYLKASNAEAEDAFGSSVSLSVEADLIVVGAPGEDSAATGVDQNQQSNSAPDAGAAYAFRESAGTWTQEAYLKAENSGTNDRFGSALSMPTDGRTLAVGAPGEASNARGVSGNALDDSMPSAGAVYLFETERDGWREISYVKASNTSSENEFGGSLAFSPAGDVLAVAALFERSESVGINGSQSQEAGPAVETGAVYLFQNQNGVWSQDTYIKPGELVGAMRFGSGISLSEDGDTLVIGAQGEAGSATGLGEEPLVAGSVAVSGAAYSYQRTDSSWEEVVYIKAPETLPFAQFGVSVTLSGDSSRLAVGAQGGCVDPQGTRRDENPAGSVYVY